MKLQVGNEAYYLGFKHKALPGTSPKSAPNADEIAGALVLALALTHPDASPIVEAYKKQGLDIEKQIDDVVERHYGAKQPISHTTECYIKSWDVKTIEEEGRTIMDRELVTSGAALCDRRDQFERATGRLIAYLRAVQNMPKDQWEAFLDAYDRSGMRLPDGVKFLILSIDKDYEEIARQYFKVEMHDGFRALTAGELRAFRDGTLLSKDAPVKEAA